MTKKRESTSFNTHRPYQTFDVPLVSRQHINKRNLTDMTGNGFWGDDTSRMPHHSVPGHSFFNSLRYLSGFLHFGTRPSGAPRATPFKPRYWNFNLSSVGISIRPMIHACSRWRREFFFVTIETQFQRFGIAPPSAAEVTAAMQGTSGSKKGHLTQQDQAADDTTRVASPRDTGSTNTNNPRATSCCRH